MKLSRTACYAIRAVIHISWQHDDGPIVGHQAARELNLSGSFLLRILVALSRAGLLDSIKGPNGGYRLARPVDTITLLDVVEAVEGPVCGSAEPVAGKNGGLLDRRLAEVCAAAAQDFKQQLGCVSIAYLADGTRPARKKGRPSTPEGRRR